MSRAASEEVIAGRAAISVNDPGTDVPEGWSRVRLTDIARLESGHTPSRKHPEWWSGDIPWVSLPDAREHHGGVIHDTTQKTNELGLANSAARLLPKDTVCLSRTASVGYVFRMGRPMATSQDFVNWVCSDALDPRFLQQALLAEGKHLLNFGMGTTHTTIYFPAVLAFHINLAPLPEQRRIVTHVEALLEQVNRAKGRLDRVPLILKRFRQAVLAAACSGELTREWRVEHSTGSADPLVERLGTARTSARSDIEIPASWNWVPFASLVENHDGRRVPVKSSEREKRRGQYAYYGASGAIDTIDDFLFDGTFLLIGEDGANLLSRSTPIAYTATGKFWVNNHAHVVQPRQGVVHGFLEAQFNSLDLQTYVTGTAQPKLTQGALNSIPMALPPTEEQHEIVRQVEKLFALADTIERRVQAATARADKLPQAILSKAFAGELVPTEAELARAEGRTYETAEELLKRVSASAPTAGSGTKARRRPTKKPG